MKNMTEKHTILADDGRSLEQVAFEAWGGDPEEFTVYKSNWRAVVKAVVAAVRPAIEAECLIWAVRRMEAVPVEELEKVYWNGDTITKGHPAKERLRARLIAAVKGDEQPRGEAALTVIDDDGNLAPISDEPSEPYHADEMPQANANAETDPYAELKAAQADGKIIQRDINVDKDNEDWRDEKNPDWKSHPTCYRIKPDQSTFQAHGYTWTRHTPGNPTPCDEEAMVYIITRREKAGHQIIDNTPQKAWSWHWKKTKDYSHDEIVGWRYADDPARPWTPAVGDTVMLKSGGPVMTVKFQTEACKFRCDWFDGSKIASGVFHKDCITPGKV